MAARRLLAKTAINIHFTRKCNYACSFWWACGRALLVVYGRNWETRLCFF